MAAEVTALAGLSRDEVAARVAAGQVNRTPSRSSRTVGQILRANLLTRFNALIGSLAALVLIFGHPLDTLFGLVIVFNSAIGVVQELRAKRTLDRLAVMARSPVRVRRDGRTQQIDPDEVVLGDLVLLGPGDRLPVDGRVREAEGLEVDESLLTGEADPVAKAPGDEVLSGSFVVAGGGAFEATAVGPQAYAARLVSEASVFSLAHSELYQGINRFLRSLTWIIVPVGALLVARQLTGDLPFSDAVVSSVAGVVPMIPEGLVLMTSIAFAVGVVRLGRRRCLVQELPAVEGLARVNTLCLDKTGTLTEPGMVLREVVTAPDTPPELARAALAALAAADPGPNPTVRAIAEGTAEVRHGAAPWRPVAATPFSSARKFSGATFDDHGTWLLGAPDVLLSTDDPLRARADVLAAEGLRVLALARAGALADGAGTGAALAVLEQRIRPAAADTLAWFAAQGVSVKVLSGDNPLSVAAVARRLGLSGGDRPVDARELPDDPGALGEVLDRHSVFGRVTPQQKRQFVQALQARGHTVAMTGDGVNDTLALKDADLGIAMGSGSGATRAVAKVVLLDDDFTVLPRVLGEGRRVLANIERVANLFLVKTVYSVILAVLVGLAHLPYPFLPRHITLVAALTIGIPAFFLALAPSDELARTGFVPRVLRFAVPAGAVCAAASFTAYLLAAGELRVERSVAMVSLFGVAFLALTLVARPLASWRLGLLAALAAAFAVVLGWPAARQVAALTVPDGGNALVVAAVVGGAAVVLYGGLRRLGWLPGADQAVGGWPALPRWALPLRRLRETAARVAGIRRPRPVAAGGSRPGAADGGRPATDVADRDNRVGDRGDGVGDRGDAPSGGRSPDATLTRSRPRPRPRPRAGRDPG